MDERTDLRLDDEGDAKITEALREIYAPPAEGAYWSSLESRILAHMRANRAVAIPVNWWTDLADWAAPGLAAAALLFVVAGAIWSRQKDDDMLLGQLGGLRDATGYEGALAPSCEPERNVRLKASNTV